ncbi:MAG: NADH-ubiquinone oxidoreductase-F iron-sulfur binding region domain-containing protein [Candidatus Methylomirabilia bacterium]
MGLIRELTRLQAQHGYLRKKDLDALSERLRVPPYRIQEVASFYPHFRLTPPPIREVAVCRDLCCFLNGSEGFGARLRERLAGRGDVEIREVSCLGRCDRAPAASVNGSPVRGGDAEAVAALLEHPRSRPGLARSGGGRRWRMDPYGEGEAPFSIYRTWAARPDDRAAEVTETLKAAGLRGMGGAGFPTGTKWELVRREAASPKYVVCNADESEPGTFKDRVLLEELPHLVIEGICFAAAVVGAERGWIYLRQEYEHAAPPLERAIAEARSRGVLGGTFDIEIFLSPGGYILGEETALLEALEDRRGEPRNRPPYPGSRGLRGNPTVVNNVETLAMVPGIVGRGAEWWKGQGVRGHQGLKVMAVSGHVERPGVYEISMGTTAAELIQMAGGVKAGQPLKAFAPGGASAPFLPAEKAELPIDFSSVEAAGSLLGSGGLVVIADGTDMIAVAANVVRFFRNESCGKCVPCRTGTEKVSRMLADILAGYGGGALVELLPRLEETLAQTSICGLGQVALNPLTSALKYWRPELDAHLARSNARAHA